MSLVQELPSDLIQFVEAELAAGRYASSDELVCAALRLLRDREQEHAALRRDIEDGFAAIGRGEYCEVRDEESQQRLREQTLLAARERSAQRSASA